MQRLQGSLKWIFLPFLRKTVTEGSTWTVNTQLKKTYWRLPITKNFEKP